MNKKIRPQNNFLSGIPIVHVHDRSHRICMSFNVLQEKYELGKMQFWSEVSWTCTGCCDRASNTITLLSKLKELCEEERNKEKKREDLPENTSVETDNKQFTRDRWNPKHRNCVRSMGFQILIVRSFEAVQIYSRKGGKTSEMWKCEMISKGIP